MQQEKLGKGLGFWGIFCFGVGVMISSGLFVLPGLAYAKSGPAVILAYLIASLFCIPALLSISELTTAMPKAGGDYFYVMKGFGPLLGTIAGFSTWFSLSLKGAFALVGIGAYLNAFLGLPLKIIALIFCGIFIFLNFLGVKYSGRLQIFLVLSMVGILFIYIFSGLVKINWEYFSPFSLTVLVQYFLQLVLFLFLMVGL